jgi:hypothetical protein
LHFPSYPEDRLVYENQSRPASFVASGLKRFAFAAPI